MCVYRVKLTERLFIECKYERIDYRELFEGEILNYIVNV